MKFFATIILTIVLGLTPAVGSNKDRVPAFPGAEGAGKFTTGGRGGIVYTVTNLNDDGPGSLRDGIQKKGPRTIVFAINGHIELKTQLVINNDDITIAGQSAPGEGICLKGHGLRINADNVIIRYIRVRPGDGLQTELDALTGMRHKNIIVDHCSLSWATDEVCSLYDNENLTLQWCIVSESLNNSYHSKGAHGYGGIWGGMKATFHHNLLAHHTSRNPRLQGSRNESTPETEHAELVNNVIYNWGEKCIYAGENARYVITHNYFKPGPATKKSARVRLLEPYAPYAHFLFSNNILESDKEISQNNLKGVQMEPDSVVVYFKDKLPKVSPYKPECAEKAYKNVLRHAGASKVRDATDRRIVGEVKNGTAHGELKGIINSQTDVGGWSELNIGEAPKDTDMDGMPDEWEKMEKLNPNDGADASAYTLDKKYTNIEIYLNTLL